MRLLSPNAEDKAKELPVDTADDTEELGRLSVGLLIFPLAYLPRHALDLNETNTDTSHMHT